MASLLKTNEIEFMQSDEQLSVIINGQNMSDLFSGYNIMHTPNQKSEIWLQVKGACTIAELSAKTKS